MTDPIPQHGLQLLSLVTAEGKLEVSLVDQPIADPRDDQVVVKVLATPINPSDLGLLFGAGDLSSAQVATRDGHPLVTADVPAPGMRAMAGRIGEAMPVGNEGSGVVIAAGASPAAQALLGKTVAMLGGAMYAQYRTLRVADCLVLPDGTARAIARWSTRPPPPTSGKCSSRFARRTAFRSSMSCAARRRQTYCAVSARCMSPIRARPTSSTR